MQAMPTIGGFDLRAVHAIPLDQKSIEQRKRILDILLHCKRGHIGSAFSILEMLRVLFDDILHYDVNQLDWPQRDRFILSKGHGCLALYLQMADKGFFPQEELYRFCAFDGILGGHPAHDKIPGVELSTGSLGHGFSVAVGMALAAKMDRNTYHTYVLLGDGECNEGTVWEAALSAAKHALNNLTVLVDYNKMQSFASTYEILDLEPMTDKWCAFGFDVMQVNGHDVKALKETLQRPDLNRAWSNAPRVVICHTIKGKGIPAIENNPQWHHKARMTEEELTHLVHALEAEAQRS